MASERYTAGVVLREEFSMTRMLLLHRTDGDYWCHVAGKREGNETALQGFVRELHEETGLSPETCYNTHYIDRFYQAIDDEIVMVPVFIAVVAPGSQVILNGEHSDYRWCDLSAASRMVVHPNMLELYRHVWRYFVDQTPDERLTLALEEAGST